MSKYPRRPPGHYLPGDSTGDKLLERIIRVDHAGEFGAKRIYEGQLSVIRDQKARDAVQHMYEQELEHLRKFEDLLTEHKVKPTVFMPLWNAAGFALGAATALMGEKAAMACTVAVEEVIDGHYSAQTARVEEGSLRNTLEAFRQEELEHRDQALEMGAEEAPLYPLLSQCIKGASRLAIWLSERL